MKKIVVLGGGISGYGSAILAKKKGFDVFLSDKGRIADRYKAKLDQWQVPYEEGHHSEERILAADEVVKSPGIPDKAPMIVKLREAGIPVISEMEFAGRYLGKARTICVTGSNGKTTTTSLIYKILRDAGYNVALGGNIGESFAYSVATGDYDWYVLELSSFQLDGMFRFRAHIGVLTNITPDHLDRYEIDTAKMRIPGLHNAYNAMAAALAALAAGVSPIRIRSSIYDFAPVEHRLEPAGEIGGVAYINDSKATNVDSTWYALESMKRPVVWIAGGTDKGNDYEPLKRFAREKVHTLVCMGIDNRKLVESFTGIIPEIISTDSLDAAMQAARKASRPGDVVLLSPACASFDLFKNYENRGELFKQWVAEHAK